MDQDSHSDDGEGWKTEIEEFESDAIESLKTGKVTVQNEDGTFRCAFCPGKKKQEYRYIDLLQHANGVSKGGRGVKSAGNHRALVKYLKEEFADAVEPLTRRVLFLNQDTPQMKANDELLVWPWMGIVMNIDNSKIEDGIKVGPGNSEMKKRFSNFNPKSVHTIWNYQGHLGIAVIEFPNDMNGYGKAQDFERTFTEAGRGKKDWERKMLDKVDLGMDIYAWIATQQDYEGDNPIGKHLREKGNLRTVADFTEEIDRKQNLLLQSLHTAISDKNKQLEDSKDHLFNLQKIIFHADIALRKAEAEKLKMEEMHKKELLYVEKEAHKVLEMQNQDMQNERLRLDLEWKALQKRCEELDKQESKNDAERIKQEMEKDQNERKLHRCVQLSELHEKKEYEKVKLIIKHEEESKDLLTEQHRQKKQLVNHQKLDMQIHSLETMLASKKLEEDEDVGGSESIKKLETELEELREEKNHLEDMNSKLTYKERELNDELQDALKEAIRILKSNEKKKDIGVKCMGELDHTLWRTALKKKFENHVQDWEEMFVSLFSSWESKIRNASWYPYKTVEIDIDKFERQIDANDEQLSKLRADLGDDIYKNFVTALNELEEYNSSGRYPIPVVWNFQENRRAKMKEILQYVSKEKRSHKRRRI